jgi:hypothetical protein
MLLEMLFVGIASLSSTGSSALNVAYSSTTEDSVSFIEQNFASFREAMCHYDGFASFSATKVEQAIEVPLLGEEKTCYLLDFDGLNGYALVGDKREMLAFSPKGSAPFDEFLCFSRYDGWGSQKPGESFIPFARSRASDGDTLCGVENTLTFISDPDAYIQAHYGSEASLQQANNKAMWPFHTQQTYSVYAKHIDGGLYEYESNCQLASIYESLEYFRTYFSLSALPGANVGITPQSDPFYSLFMNQHTASGNSLYTIAHDTLPSIYQKIRAWFIQNDNYQFGPSHLNQTANCLAYLASQYSVSITGVYSTTWSLNDLISDVTKQKVCDVFCVVDGTAPKHAMPITGRRVYKKTTGWWIFQHTDYYTLMGFNNNKSGSQKFLDFTSAPSGTLMKISIAL